jgi:dihydropteroate synthase
MLRHVPPVVWPPAVFRGESVMKLVCGVHSLDLSAPCVMGILNVTPDSFSDGGRFLSAEAAVSRAMAMQQAGAAIIDVGGESTRPGAAPVSEKEELARVLPVIESLSASLQVPVSVDTMKPRVMTAAVAAGASLINDVNALQAPGAMDAAAASGAAVCLMHMQGQPRTMQQSPVYADVVGDVRTFLAERVRDAMAAGIPRDRIVVDPGFGFGKTLAHNLRLLESLDRFVALGVPVLAGISRKSMIGTLLGDRPVDDRLHGSVAAAVIAAMKGARILRVHDVGATVDALKVVTAVMESAQESDG